MDMEAVNQSGETRRLDFERHRKRLWGIAYRMLGSRADADDMLQDAFLRWHGTATGDIRAPEAWLATTVTRLCIDRLRQLRVEREKYVGPWLPEPLVAESAPLPDRVTELESDVSLAFLALLERLGPEERAAFVLHEAFESGYDEIAALLGKSEAACRQIVRRAKQRVEAGRPRVEVNAEAQATLLATFAQALRAGDQEALLRLFAEDASWTSDGGGKAFAARKVLVGRERIARFLMGLSRRLHERLELRPVVVNGAPGLAWIWSGRLRSVLSIASDGARILGAYSVLNPDKLRGVTLTKIDRAPVTA